MDLLSTVFDCSKYANAKDEIYVKYYIAFDVRSVHVLRVQENINDDYEYEDGCVLLEHGMYDYNWRVIEYFEENMNIDRYTGDDRLFIEKMFKTLGPVETLKAIVGMDAENGFENEECQSFNYMTVDEVVDQEIIKGDGLSPISI